MAAEYGKWLATLPLLLFLSCTVDGPVPVTTYERILIDTYEPQGGLPIAFVTDTYLSLYDASGNLLDEDDNGNTDTTTSPDTDQADSSRIDYTTGLNSGTYYIKVSIGGSAQTIGTYALRVLSLSLVEAIPIPVYPVTVDVSSEADYELLDAPEAAPPLSVTPVSIALETNNFGRILDSTSDLDWLMFTLP